MEINVIVEKYIALRDKKAQMKAEFEEKTAGIDKMLEKVEAKLQEFFTSTGTESVKTASGTAYQSVRTSATVADGELYLNWVFEDPNGRRSFLEKRVAKKEVEAYIAETGELPPGVNVFRQLTVNIRRS